MMSFSIRSLLGSCLLLSLSAYAGPHLQVLKAKGQRALVTFPDGKKPAQGAQYRLGKKVDASGESDEEFEDERYNYDDSSARGSRASAEAFAGRRKYSIGLSSSLIKSSPGSFASSFSGDFGFNWEHFEAGPSLLFSRSGTGKATVSLFGGGAFANFNFIPNTPKEWFVPGVAAEASFSKGSQSITQMLFSGSLYGKFFVLGASSSAIRLDLLFNFSRNKVGKLSSNTKQFGGSVGIQTYF